MVGGRRWRGIHAYSGTEPFLVLQKTLRNFLARLGALVLSAASLALRFAALTPLARPFKPANSISVDSWRLGLGSSGDVVRA